MSKGTLSKRSLLDGLSKADALGTLISKFLDPDIDLSPNGNSFASSTRKTKMTRAKPVAVRKHSRRRKRKSCLIPALGNGMADWWKPPMLCARNWAVTGLKTTTFSASAERDTRALFYFGKAQRCSRARPTPTALYHSAQGCRVGEATLGSRIFNVFQPQGGCGLTADVVTGKLDVRAAAARLPESEPEMEEEEAEEQSGGADSPDGEE
jgi:hypothetical protein